VTNVIVRALGLPLDEEGKRVEDLYAPSENVQLKAVG
jgi:DNA sulfur modification protein DndB